MTLKELIIKNEQLKKEVTNEKIEKKVNEIFRNKKYKQDTEKKIKELFKNL